MKVKLLVPLLLLMVACTPNKPMTDEQKAAVKEEGSAVVKEFFDAMSTMNLEKIKDLMENNDDFSFTIVSGDILSFDGMMEIASQYEPYVESQTFDTKYEKYVIVSPSCFVYTWHGRNGAKMKTGEEVMLEDYFATYCFRKHEDGWKLFIGHESEKIPMPIDTTAVQ
jgi:ketosteroid isomerase-like protein